jgi:ribosomal protein S18 acetylase RimI-like enzyme
VAPPQYQLDRFYTAQRAAILALEQRCYERPWDESEFVRKVYKERSASGRAMLRSVKEALAWPVAGYLFFRLEDRAIHLVRMGVDPADRRRGVGRGLIAFAQGYLSKKRRDLIVDVHERDLQAQLFLRACGIRLVAIKRREGGDFYRFRCRWNEHWRSIGVPAVGLVARS